MTTRLDEFKDYMRSVSGFGAATQSSYISIIRRADRILISENKEGVDELLSVEGTDSLFNWAKNLSKDQDAYPSDIRSAVKKYIEFHTNENYEPLERSSIATASEPQVSVFNLEKDMQAAVRRQLHQLEAGLVEADDGREQSVSTGRIDILARDAKGHYVVIELKAGRCPKGAIEQVLGYAYALKEERPEIEIRSILVAGDFFDQTLAAAKLIPNLTLKTYLFSFQFQDVGMPGE